jgi:hypothetical protein
VPNTRKAPLAGRKSGKTEYALGVCSALSNGKPDMYNAVPKRSVSQDESRAHGWPHFWDGITKCPQGHVAARYMSNTYRCVDCARIADGKLPIYGVLSNEDLISEAVGKPSYTDPALRTDFKWHDENFRQFLVAYTNLGDVTEALKLVNALPYDLITELRNNPERAALFEATRRDVDQVFLWKAEGSAATGSDRAMLARAGATFPDRFGSRNQSGIDTEAYVNPDKAVAELAKLLSSASESLAQQDALGIKKPSRVTSDSTDLISGGDDLVG